jgi:hypothetical protein
MPTAIEGEDAQSQALLNVVKLSHRYAEQRCAEQAEMISTLRLDVHELQREVRMFQAERSTMEAALTSQAAQIMQLREQVLALLARTADDRTLPPLSSAPLYGARVPPPPEHSHRSTAASASSPYHSVPAPSSPPALNIPSVMATGRGGGGGGAAAAAETMVPASPIAQMQGHVDALSAAIRDAALQAGAGAGRSSCDIEQQLLKAASPPRPAMPLIDPGASRPSEAAAVRAVAAAEMALLSAAPSAVSPADTAASGGGGSPYKRDLQARVAQLEGEIQRHANLCNEALGTLSSTSASNVELVPSKGFPDHS